MSSDLFDPPHEEAAVRPPMWRRGLRGLYRPRVLIVVAGVALSAVFVPRIPGWLPTLNDRPEFRVTVKDIRVIGRPAWVPDDLLTRVIKASDLPSELSLLDTHLSQHIAEAFVQNAWVTAVRVRKATAPPRIEVEVQCRKPVAVVEVPNGIYVVDAEGVLLPPNDFTLATTERLPRIQGVETLPAGPAGDTWGDGAVTAAAMLAGELAQCWQSYGLQAIVVRQHITPMDRDDATLCIVTRGGTQILWGRGPNSQHPGELSVEKKLGRLEEYLQLYGSFDEPHGAFEIDIRHWRDMTRRPLTAAADSSRH